MAAAVADEKIFSYDGVAKQVLTAPFRNGYYTLEFYVKNGKPAAERTDETAVFYLYPSGGTLRDADFNLLFYDRRFDEWAGFQHPHRRTSHIKD